MANREVNLTKRVQTWQGTRYCRVALSANGRVKPDLVLVNGELEHHTLFAACDQQQRMWFEFFLMTRRREREAMHRS